MLHSNCRKAKKKKIQNLKRNKRKNKKTYGGARKTILISIIFSFLTIANSVKDSITPLYFNFEIFYFLNIFPEINYF